MKAQKYKIIGTGSETDSKLTAGQFVHRNDRDTGIRGYISAVNPYSFDIILFEPDDVPDDNHFIIIHEIMTPDEIADDLSLLLAGNKELLSMWDNVANNPIKKD